MATFTEVAGGSIVNARNANNIGHVSQIILTEAEYLAIAVPDPDTLYYITEM